MTITLASGQTLEGAICLDCPGGSKIYPASDLPRHKKAYHSGIPLDGRFCSDCGDWFVHQANENPDVTMVKKCGMCRRNAGKLRNRRRA